MEEREAITIRTSLKDAAQRAGGGQARGAAAAAERKAQREAHALGRIRRLQQLAAARGVASKGAAKGGARAAGSQAGRLEAGVATRRTAFRMAMLRLGKAGLAAYAAFQAYRVSRATAEGRTLQNMDAVLDYELFGDLGAKVEANQQVRAWMQANPELLHYAGSGGAQAVRFPPDLKRVAAEVAEDRETQARGAARVQRDKAFQSRGALENFTVGLWEYAKGLTDAERLLREARARHGNATTRGAR